MKLRNFFPTGMLALLLSIGLLSSCGGGDSAEKTGGDSTAVKETADETPAISGKLKEFYNWYLSKAQEFGSFQIITTDKTYRINFGETEKLLDFLKTSGHFSENFLNSWREFFKERDKFFQESKQNEGPPEGFEMDPFTYSQDGETTIQLLASAKWTITFKGNEATATSGPTGESPGVKITLNKMGNAWLISKVEAQK